MKTFHRDVLLLSAIIIAWSLSVQAGQDGADGANRTAPDGVRYSVAISGERAILVDRVTGETWLLTESPTKNEPPAWLPLRRINDSDEARDWQRVDLQVAGDEQLILLKKRLQFMQSRFAPGAATIVDLQEQIEQLEQDISEKQSEKSVEIQTVISKALLPLLIQEMELLQTHGENHPEVIAIRKKIEITREFLRNDMHPKNEAR
ncbi:MAG: hypothetical protein AB7I48_09855 [Planctomycetaceae bacterium]